MTYGQIILKAPVPTESLKYKNGESCQNIDA